MRYLPFRFILILDLIFALCFVGGCFYGNERSSNPSQSTPTLETKAEPQTDSEDFSAAETCEKIKEQQEQTLCNAIAAEMGLTDRVLTAEFVYHARKIDLNNDGRTEIVVWVPTRDLGGTSGYPIAAYTETANGLQRVLYEEDWTPIILLASVTNGWHELAIKVAGGGVDPYFRIMQFRDGKYTEGRTQIVQPKGEIVIGKDWEQSVFGPLPTR